MKDPRLAAALLESSPDALSELFDTYGDRLFRYCWSMLRSRELAQAALRETLLVAQAHITRLADPEDPESLGPWLYSLARAECRRHQAVPPAAAAESPARPGRPAADGRLTSWNAAMSLDAAEFEALDLACRHHLDLALVLGLPAGETDGLLDRARQKLQRSLGAETLAGRGPACPDREAILARGSTGLAGQPGPLAAEARERVLEHADRCQACGPAVPRNVSATRVFAVLPAPALSPQDRAGMLAALVGHRPPAAPGVIAPPPAVPGAVAPPAVAGMSAFGPSLASYVRAPEPPAHFLAAPARPAARPAAGPAPLAAFAAVAASSAPAGPHAPAVPASSPSPQQASRPRRMHRDGLLIAGAGVVVSAIVMASVVAATGPGGHDAAGSMTPARAAGGVAGATKHPSGPRAAASVRYRAAAGGAGDRPARTRLATLPPLVSTKRGKNQAMTAATQPLPPDQAPGARPAGGGTSAAQAVPGTLQLSASAIVLGPGNAGQITLTATGGPVSWSASVSPPDQVSLSSYAGTLPTGQSITVMVQVSWGCDAGGAAISFQDSGSETQVVPVSWPAQPDGSGPSWHRHWHGSPPGSSLSWGSIAGTDAPNPTS